MSKQSSAIPFRKLLIALADRIGRQHLPINDDAHEIADFVGQDAVHCHLVPVLVRAIYKSNRCGHLDALVTAEPTLDAVGRIQGDLLRCATTDLDQLALVRAIGEYLSQQLELVTPDFGSEENQPDGDLTAATNSVFRIN